MILSFTGTSHRPIPTAQAMALEAHLLERWDHGWRELHHGDCAGADALVHRIALTLGFHITRHPPVNPKLRAFCAGGDSWPPRDYMPRNQDIVNAGKELLALPRGFAEELRSGTWATIRMAWRAQKRVTAIWPDGRVSVIRGGGGGNR